MSLESQIANLFQEFVNQQRGKLASEVNKLQGDVKDAYQQRDKLAVEVGNLQKELVEVSQRRDRLTIENAGLHGKLDNREAMMNALNDRITELEGENQNLLRRIGELRNSSTYKLQEENEQLRKENEALKKGNEESPTTSTEEKRTATIEAWLVGSSVDKLRLVWATEEYVNALDYTFTKRANELNFSADDDAYFAPVKVRL